MITNSKLESTTLSKSLLYITIKKKTTLL